METEIIVSIIGVSGVSIAAFLSGLGYYLKTRAERSINKRVVLFHLLEFRRQFEISYRDPKEISDQYFEYCISYCSRKGLDGDSNIPNELRNAIDRFLFDLVAAKTPKIDDAFIQAYEDSLKKLCESDPVLAFKLRGSERKNEILEAKRKYIFNYNEIKKNKVPDSVNKAIDQELKSAGELQNSALLKDLERDILSTAWSCSFYTWVKCLRITSKKMKAIEFNRVELEPLFDRLLKIVKDETRMSSESSMGMGDSLASVGRNAGLKNDDLIALEQSVAERMKFE